MRSGLNGRDALGVDRLDLSVVIPLYNEAENVDATVAELLVTLDEMPQSAEVILVDDGSRDGTGERAFHWTERDSRVRVIQFRRNFGQTAAITAGFRNARGRVVVVLDGDQQNDPRDIPLLLERMSEGYDVVSGWRKNRKDKLFLRKIPSRLANRLISRVTGTRLHDYGCTLKAYDAEVIRHVHLYGELHRFIPALCAMVGAEVTEVPVNHRPRTRGTSKYGISRTLRVVLDLLTVKFLLKYVSRPMQIFGLPGLLSFFTGLGILAYLFVERIFFGHGIADRPLLVGALLVTILGIQFISMGILGEQLTRIYFENGDRVPYVIRATGGFTEAVTPLAELVGGANRSAAPATTNGSHASNGKPLSDGESRPALPISPAQ